MSKNSILDIVNKISCELGIEKNKAKQSYLIFYAKNQK